MEASSATSDEERALLAWLEGEPAETVGEDLTAFRGRLRLGPADGWAACDMRLLEAAAERVLDMADRLRPQLLAVRLPAPVALYELAERVGGALLDVAGWFAERIERERRSGSERSALCLGGLGLLSGVFVLSGLAAAPVPAGAWRQAHRFARLGDVLRAPGDDPARCAYLRLIAVAVSQPEGLTGRELAWAFEFFDARVLAAAGFDAGAAAGSAASWWIDSEADAGPQALARRPAPAGPASCWFFNPRPMAQKLGECADWITTHMTAAELAGMNCDVEPLAAADGGFPPGLSPLEMLALLRRLRNHWMATPLREQPRRQNQYSVQVCMGLAAVWSLGCGARVEAGQVHEWVVLNESPAGLAIMSAAGAEANVDAGVALALRRDPQQPWAVCVVRWIRSESPGQLELGLQLIGPSFQSVRVGFRGRATQQLAPALALPVMEPMRRHPAMLAPAGTYASRRFVFVRDGVGVYVAQARALGLDMQTQGVELFQYEIDPYPI